MAAQGKNGVDFNSNSRLGQETTVPVLAREDDVEHLLPAPEAPPGTTAMDVDFDSDMHPAQAAVAAATGTDAKVEIDSGYSPAQTAATAANGTAADIDFDSDSFPTQPAVTVATGTAADVDFDSDSSVATPVTAPATNVGGVSFDSESQLPTGENGADNSRGVEELLRLASEVEEEGQGGISGTRVAPPTNSSSVHRTGSEPLQQGRAEPGDKSRCIVIPAPPGDNTERHTVKSKCGLQASPNSDRAQKRRRCGTVYLGAAASDRGFCASSLSQR